MAATVNKGRELPWGPRHLKGSIVEECRDVIVERKISQLLCVSPESSKAMLPRNVQSLHSSKIVPFSLTVWREKRKKGFAKQMKDVKEIEVRIFKLQTSGAFQACSSSS